MPSRTSRTVEYAFPLAHPEVCEASQRTDACHRANLAVYVSASSSSRVYPPRRAGVLPFGDVPLTRSIRALVRLGFTRDTRFRFCFLRAHSELFTRNRAHPVHCHVSEGPGGLGHLRLTATRTHRSRGSHSECPLRRDAEVVATPVIIDQCQQPTIHCFQRWAPVVSVHSASRIPRVAVAHGPRRFEPASVGAPAFRGRYLPSLHLRAFRACFVAARDARRNARIGWPRPPATMIASTGVAREPRALARRLGDPPDGLDRIRCGA